VSELTFSNPMIALPEFSLHDSMSAVELMDPKMDQCCGVDGSVSCNDLIRNVPLPEHIDDETVIKLLQSLVVLETALLDGMSQLETTHNCLLLWPDSWAALAAKAVSSADPGGTKLVLSFCQSIYHTANNFSRTVLVADIYEGEARLSTNATGNLNILIHCMR